jgi:hypothetical protein
MNMAFNRKLALISTCALAAAAPAWAQEPAGDGTIAYGWKRTYGASVNYSF